MTTAQHDDTHSPADSSMVRLFFALWPDAATVRALSEWSARAHAACGGRPMHLDTLHITLAFLGNVPARLTETLARHTAAQRMAPGTLTLNRYGVFARQHIVWTGPADEDAATLEREVQRLWEGLAPLHTGHPEHRFRPHVTLLRNANPAVLPEPAAPIVWTYDRYVLVRSALDGQSRYQALATSRA